MARTDQMVLREELLERAAALGPAAAKVANCTLGDGRVSIERHPLGMLVVRYELADGAVRLHVWTPETSVDRDELGQVHDHIWDLESHVLQGGVEHTTFRLDEAPASMTVLWEHDYDRASLRSTGRRVDISALSQDRHEVGSSYRLPAGVMHSALPTSLCAATLVRSTSTSRRVARIVGGPSGVPMLASERREGSAGQVLEALRAA